MLNLKEVAELKTLAEENFNTKIHLHDTCSGEYFTLEGDNKALKKFIIKFLKSKGKKAEFSKDGLSFTVS